jgi:hypothetical protein
VATVKSSQVSGIDLSKIFAPVLNDVSFRIMLIAKLVWNMTRTVIDIETAFLHGDLDEEIYMEVPKGLEIDHNNKLMLRKTIYVLRSRLTTKEQRMKEKIQIFT